MNADYSTVSTDEQSPMHGTYATALQLIFDRLHEISTAMPNEFPLYSISTNNKWKGSVGGSWVGGFWAACWWLMAAVTKSEADLEQAQEIYKKLSAKLDTNSINRSLIFWYGAAPGVFWHNDKSVLTGLKLAKTKIQDSYIDAFECIPLGSALGGGVDGDRMVCIDSLAASIQLLSVFKDVASTQMAKQHLDSLLGRLRQDDGRFLAQAYILPSSIEANAKPLYWSRGQAWGILGLARAADVWGEPYLSQTKLACLDWIELHKFNFPKNYPDDAKQSIDVSAALIVSLALLVVAKIRPQEPEWKKMAEQQLLMILGSEYFIEGKNRKGTLSEGGFWGCAINVERGEAELCETVWGYFILMQVLCVLLEIEINATTQPWLAV